MRNEKIRVENIKYNIAEKLRTVQLDNILFSYLTLKKNNPSNVFIVSTYSAEWVDFYISNKYQYIDPVVLTAFNRIKPFSWGECVSVQELKNLSKVFTQSSQYGISDGFSFVLHDYDNNLAILSLLICSTDEQDYESVIIKNKMTLQEVLVDIHSDYLMSVRTPEEKKYNRDNILTLRENEVFYWVSKGKTNVEAGLILGLSPGTIKFHMRNIARKLGVSNSKHAIRLGIELKLIKSP